MITSDMATGGAVNSARSVCVCRGESQLATTNHCSCIGDFYVVRITRKHKSTHRIALVKR